MLETVSYAYYKQPVSRILWSYSYKKHPPNESFTEGAWLISLDSGGWNDFKHKIKDLEGKFGVPEE